MQSRDHHDVHCAFDCSVRIAENASDRRLLGEVLMADRNAAESAKTWPRISGSRFAGEWKHFLANALPSM